MLSICLDHPVAAGKGTGVCGNLPAVDRMPEQLTETDFQGSYRTKSGSWSCLPSNSFSRLGADLYDP
jgi:hypothetical protein